MRKLVFLGAALIATVTLAGCDMEGKVTEPFNDAPRGKTNDIPADIIVMPDGFNNAARKCDGPNSIYTLFHSDSAYGGIAVVPNDPRCATK